MVNKLEIDGVQFRFSAERSLLSDVYLKCQTGKIVGLLGRNGSGKSTLFQLLFGTLQTESCSVRLNGKHLPRAYASGELAYLPQQGFLPRGLNVKKVIALFIANETDRKKLREADRIADLLALKVEDLSGGQLRYLEVRLLLALEVKFLLLDEPFLGIEPLYKELLQQLLRTAAVTTGILLADHDYTTVLAVSDELYLLKEGVVRQIKNRDELVMWGYLPG